MKCWYNICIVNCGIKKVKTGKLLYCDWQCVLCAHPELLVKHFYTDLHPIRHPDCLKVKCSQGVVVLMVSSRPEIRGLVWSWWFAQILVAWAVAFVQLSQGSSQWMFIHISLVILTIYARTFFFPFCFLRLKKVDMNIDDRKCAVCLRALERERITRLVWMNEWSRPPETCVDEWRCVNGAGWTGITVGVTESRGQTRVITVSYTTDSQNMDALDSSSNRTRERLKSLPQYLKYLKYS